MTRNPSPTQRLPDCRIPPPTAHYSSAAAKNKADENKRADLLAPTAYKTAVATSRADGRRNDGVAAHLKRPHSLPDRALSPRLEKPRKMFRNFKPSVTSARIALHYKRRDFKSGTATALQPFNRQNDIPANRHRHIARGAAFAPPFWHRQFFSALLTKSAYSKDCVRFDGCGVLKGSLNM